MISNNGKISSMQAFILLLCSMQSGALLLLPYLLARFGMGGFFIIWLGSIFALLVVLLLDGVINNSVFKVMYFVLLTLSVVLQLLVWQEMLGSEFLIYTPKFVTVALVMAVIFYLYNSGLQCIARLAQLVLPFLLVVLILLLFGSFSDMHLMNMLGLDNENVLEGIAKGYIILPLFSGIWIWPYLKENSNCKIKVGVLAIVCASILVSLEYMAVLLCFAKESENLYWGIITLSKLVRIGTVIDRLEAICINEWLVFVIISASIMLRAGFNKKSAKAKGVLFASIFILVLLVDNVVVLKGVYNLVGVIMLFLWLILLLWAWIDKIVEARKV